MTHDEMIDVITHHKNGGEVEYYTGDDIGWILCDDPVWNFGENDYRPKPEPMKIYAEICEKNGILMRTSKVPINRIYSGTIIKTFIEAP
jgi:hypothetical protein